MLMPFLEHAAKQVCHLSQYVRMRCSRRESSRATKCERAIDGHDPVLTNRDRPQTVRSGDQGCNTYVQQSS